MQLTRCPICHSRIGLEALIHDDAGRELLALVAKTDSLYGHALVSYIGLFRSATRDLANDRALRLAREVQQLGTPAQLTAAMAQTVENMRQKAHNSSFKPLSNHNYLKRVLDDTAVTGISPAPALGVMPEAAQIEVVNTAGKRRQQLTKAVLDINNTDW